MEGYGRAGNSDSDIRALQESPLELRYLTHQAREIVDELGLNGLTIHYQVLLMEYCYNYNYNTVKRMLAKNQKDANYALSPRAVIQSFHESRMPSAPSHRVSFDVNGTKNLLVLDRSIVIADYSVRLDLLANILNALPETMLMEWIKDAERCPMPIALYELQEFLSVDKEQREELESMMKFTPIQYSKTDEAGRKILEETLAHLRSLKRDNDKLEG